MVCPEKFFDSQNGTLTENFFGDGGGGGGGRRKKFLSSGPKEAEKGPPTQNMPKGPVFLRYATDSASSGAELCRSCVPPTHQLASLLQSLALLLYLNCNCCSQLAYHHVITQITVSHFASNNFLLYDEK